jgi:hypothetical protein
MGVLGVAINRGPNDNGKVIIPSQTVRQCLCAPPLCSLDSLAHRIAPSPMKRSVPVSSYYYGPPPADSAYFTPPLGQIGVHHPREIVRVERDYSGGEIVQFASTFPMELEGRVSHLSLDMFFFFFSTPHRSRPRNSWKVSMLSTRFSYLLITCGALWSIIASRY